MGHEPRTPNLDHADLRLRLRRLRPQVRAIPVDERGRADEVPEVQKEKASAVVRRGRGRRLQGFWLLSNRLPERVVQEERRGR